MSAAQLLLSVLITLLLQLLVGERMAIFGIRPDLTVLILVLFAQRRGPAATTVLGFCLGLLQDLLVPATLGMNMLAKSVVGFAVGRISKNLVAGGLPLQAGLVGVAVLLHDAIYLTVYTGLDIVRGMTMFFTEALPVALYTSLCAFLILGAAAAIGAGRLFGDESLGSR